MEHKTKAEGMKYLIMKQRILIFSHWAVFPFFLISLWMAVCATVGNTVPESTATTHAIMFHRRRTTPEAWQPLVSQTPSKNKAKEGETVLLGCQFRNPHGPSSNNLTVRWFKEDEKGQRDLMENNVTVAANSTRVSMIGNLSEGDASLTIVNVTTSDHGTYFCQVILPTGEVVTGDGTKLRIQRAMGFFGIEESIGTIIGVLAASIGGLVVLIIVLVPHLRKCLPCAKRTSHQEAREI